MIEAHDVFFVPEQFPTIQSAVDAAERPTTIMAAPGYYDESVIVTDKEYVVIQSARLTRRGVTLTGGPGPGIFVVERSTLYLSGIEVRSDGRMRGIWASDSKLSLQDCVVAGNRISLHGGATSADASPAPGAPSYGNTFGAGMFCRRSSVRVQKSAIIGNTIGSNIDVDCGESSGDLHRGPAAEPDQPDASPSEARGGGLYFEDCKVEIAGSVIQANAVYCKGSARGGGIWCEGSRMRMWRSRVTDNALRARICEGAGIYFKEPLACELGGSVITGNGSVEGKGGGVFVEGDFSTVAIHRNTAVRQNHPDDVYPRR